MDENIFTDMRLGRFYRTRSSFEVLESTVKKSLLIQRYSRKGTAKDTAADVWKI